MAHGLMEMKEAAAAKQSSLYDVEGRIQYFFDRFYLMRISVRLLIHQHCESRCASSSSSRMRVIYHNWSATKQRLHPQSVAEISHHSVLSGDRIRQCETSSWSRHKDRSVSVSCHFLLQARSVPVSVICIEGDKSCVTVIHKSRQESTAGKATYC